MKMQLQNIFKNHRENRGTGRTGIVNSQKIKNKDGNKDLHGIDIFITITNNHNHL